MRKSDQTSSSKIDFWLDLLRGNSARKFGNSPEAVHEPGSVSAVLEVAGRLAGALACWRWAAAGGEGRPPRDGASCFSGVPGSCSLQG